MQAFRLCRSAYPAYDGEGARRVGGRWNSRGVRVLYMSESRSLAVLEILVHLSSTLPDKYLLGAANIPHDVAIERIAQEDLPVTWSTLNPAEQIVTKRLGDVWVQQPSDRQF
jgi:RES domain-containing protein